MSGRTAACAASICAVVSLLVAGEARAFPGGNHRSVGQYRDHDQSTSRSSAGRQTSARPPRRPSRPYAGSFGDAFMVDTGVTLGPAPRPQYSYCAASNGDGWRVMWANEIDYYTHSVNTSGIGADGSLLDDWGGVVGHVTSMSGGLTRSMVGTGSGFITVWASTNSPSGIWASRLDSAGALVDSLPVFEGDSSQAWPSVTFDGDSTCLVVWTATNDIYAARLTTGGQVLDTNPLPVAQDPSQREQRPTVAFGQGVYLVAWIAYDSSDRATARARRVSADGAVLDTAIFLRHVSAVTQADPAVAFGDTCFLAAWSEDRDQPDVYAARVSVSGNLIDTAGIQLSSGPAHDKYPSVGFDGTKYLVMWEEEDSTTQYSTLCGRRMTVDGVPLDSGLIRPGPAGHTCRYPSVAADQANFLVAFCAGDTLTGDANGCCVRISPDGAVLDSGVFFPLGADAQTGPSGASDGTDFLAAWIETRPEGQTVIQAARIAADGSLLDPVGFTVNDEPGAKSSVATTFGDSVYLVAWADNRSAEGDDIYCTRVSPEGQVLDANGVVVCDESLRQSYPDISFDGQNFLLVWYDYRSGTDGDVYAARVSPGGVVLDPDGFAVSADSCEDAWPTLCFADTDYLVVWGRGLSWRGPYDIYGALVSRDGVVTKPRFLVSGATGNQWYQAVASGPTGSLVAWVDTRLPNTEPDIFGARVSTDGTVLDTNGFPIAATNYHEKRPQVTSDQAGFRVLWNHWTPTGGTVFTTGRVDTAGGVSRVEDWFRVSVSGPDQSIWYDAVYGSGPELLLLFSFRTDTALGRYYSNHRLWGRLGDVPGVEQTDDRQARRLTGGASVVRGVLFMPASGVEHVTSSVLLDISGRKVLDLHSGANDVRALAPGVYFVRSGPSAVDRQPSTVAKVVVTR